VTRPGYWLRTTLAAGVLAACSGADEERATSSFGAPDQEPAAVTILVSSPATAFAGPDGTGFEVTLRTTEVTQYPCSACHQARVVPGLEPDEHADIRPVHPEKVGLTCGTCHDEGNPALLTLQNGEAASLDEAYRLCAQCHYSQADDWAGGAHGKRLAAWQGRRVVMSCTGCHDPHDPLFEDRIPFRGPTVPRVARRGP
jgi:hypothetical protein